LEFMDTVRRAERAILTDRRGSEVAAELDATPLGVVAEEQWRRHWPAAVQPRDRSAEER
jgi:XTP/dITP diphosphohydrolase